MTDNNALEVRVSRLEDRADRMNETLATKEDIKLLHDRMNTLTVIMVVGFIFSIGSAVLSKFIG